MSRIKLKLFFALFCINCILIKNNAFPVHDVKQAAQYLKQFGYFDVLGDLNNAVIGPDAVSSAIKEFQRFVGLKETDNNEISHAVVIGPDAVSNAIKEFQRFIGLKETGKLDRDTVSMMQAPRCGIKDNAVADPTRKKRYAHQGSKWYTHLTYRITKYPANTNDRKQVDKAIARAFKMWSDAAAITFEEKKEGNVNIDIRFEIGNHGDGYAFDGPGSVLAHAFFPQFGGNAHFDDQETWTFAESSGINMLQVAAHEFGHSLGLSHSEDTQALMAPIYLGYQPSFVLHGDDVQSITALYGTREQVPPPRGEEPAGPAPDAPDLCQDASIDTITRIQNGDTYVFKGDFYWKVTDKIADGYPRRIGDDWGGLEGNLDASVTWPNGKTYFFKGGRYWSFTNKNIDSGYPQPISRGFRGVPDNLDAACVWSGNGQSYFFKGDQYWKYDNNANPPVSRDYPMPISNWRGLPNFIDAALLWDNNKNYFFKGDQYYRFNDTRDAVDPEYPFSTAQWWFGCNAASQRAG